MRGFVKKITGSVPSRVVLQNQETKVLKLRDIIQVVDGNILTQQSDLNLEIQHAAACDLMSDVLAFSKPYALLLTGLTNIHVIRTAEMADIAAIILVRNKLPKADVISLADEKGIPLISSPCTMFDLCGRLYEAGLRGCEIAG